MLLHFYVEDDSTEAALIHLVPAMVGDIAFDYEIFPFQGKTALMRNLPNRLKAYRHRPGNDWRVIVLVDRDDNDCKWLKQHLENIAFEAELKTKTHSQESFQVINRIAVEELEAWFFGDVEALRTAYPRVDSNLAEQASYRDSDAIKGGTWEQLERLLKHYHPGGLEKVRAATEISQHMQPAHNRSQSFQAFYQAIQQLFL